MWRLLTTYQSMPPQRGAEMSQESIGWSELAELTHETQVYKFGWCMCEDTEPHEYPYSDCPKTGEK
jgi:hypothetical protein